MVVQVAVAVLVLILCYCALKYTKHLMSLSKYPNGPFPLPMIGNVHYLVFSNRHPFVVFAQLAKKYGDVFSFSLGMDRWVIVNSIELTKEALLRKGTDFQGRPVNRYEFALVSRNYKGIIMADYNPGFVFSRNLGHKSMKMYGEGFMSLEEKITAESESLIERIKEANCNLVPVRTMMGNAVLNVMGSMLFGNRYNLTDPDFQIVDKFNHYLTSFELRPDPAGAFPWTQLFYLSPNIKRIREGVKLRDEYISKQLKQHVETYDPDHIRDFCDSLIKSVRESEDSWKKGDPNSNVTDSLEMILSDIIIAGAETTATTLTWAVLYILHFPDIQHQLYDEMIENLGPDTFPQLKDRPKLPQYQAFIQEVLRMGSQLVPHKAIRTSSIGGKNIVEGTQVMFNLWAVNNDPREWEDPEAFNPRRWLDEEGKCIEGYERSYLPFGAGRRACLGEQMAKHELYLFLTRIIKTFIIQPNEKEGFPGFKNGNVGLIYSPLAFTAMFIPRNK